MKLGSQVFVSHTTPEPHLILPVENELFWKPRKGGMWTSTLDEEGGDWVRWLKGENYPLDDWGGKLWRLEPAEARVYCVATPFELRALHRTYPLKHDLHAPRVRTFDLLIDWEAMSADYDGVWIPAPWSHRFTDDYEASMFFYVMDAECTCWFRWCFEGEPQLLEPASLGSQEGGD